MNPLKKSVKKANTRYWQFLLTYFQSKSEKKNNFQKTNTSRASIVHLFENFSSCGRQTKKVLSFSIDFELQILEKQQNNKNQDTRPPMFPLTILKNFNWCSANLSKRRRQLGGEIDFYVKFSLYSNSFCNNPVISFYWPYGLWQWTKIISFHFSPLQNRHKFLNENSYLFCHQLSNKYLDKWKNPNGDKNEPII